MRSATKSLWDDNRPSGGTTGGITDTRSSTPEAQTKSSPSLSCSVVHAARAGHKEEVLALLKSPDADVNEEHEGNTPCLIAAYRGWEDVMLELIDRGVDFNVKTNLGETPLMRAVKGGGKFSPETIDKMLAAGARRSVNVATEPGAFFPGWTALHFAADPGLNSHPEVITILLKHGANPNLKDHHGKTPADVASGAEAANPGTAVDYVNALNRKTSSVFHTSSSTNARPSTTDSIGRSLSRTGSLQDFAKALFGGHHHDDGGKHQQQQRGRSRSRESSASKEE